MEPSKTNSWSYAVLYPDSIAPSTKPTDKEKKSYNMLVNQKKNLNMPVLKI